MTFAPTVYSCGSICILLCASAINLPLSFFSLLSGIYLFAQVGDSREIALAAVYCSFSSGRSVRTGAKLVSAMQNPQRRVRPLALDK